MGLKQYDCIISHQQGQSCLSFVFLKLWPIRTVNTHIRPLILIFDFLKSFKCQKIDIYALKKHAYLSCF